METKQKKQVYEGPSVTVIPFESRDIITTSPDENEKIEGEIVTGS